MAENARRESYVATRGYRERCFHGSHTHTHTLSAAFASVCLSSSRVCQQITALAQHDGPGESFFAKCRPLHHPGQCQATMRLSIYSLYTGWAKKQGHRRMTIILSILNRFKNFFSLEDSLVNLQLNLYQKSRRILYMLLHYLVKH